ncbi:MAG: hypothetical protein Q9162_003473 [Coniocarpon cinnabarinum]
MAPGTPTCPLVAPSLSPRPQSAPAMTCDSTAKSPRPIFTSNNTSQTLPSPDWCARLSFWDHAGSLFASLYDGPLLSLLDGSGLILHPDAAVVASLAVVFLSRSLLVDLLIMKPVSSVLLAAGLAAAQSEPQGPDAAPFPNSVYPGYAEPYAVAGAQSGQTSPPFYPSPWMSGAGNWSAAYTSAQNLVRQMTLAEKVNLTTGTGWETERCVGQTGAVPRLGIRSLCMQDSPVGVRDSSFATVPFFNVAYQALSADYNSVFPAGGTIAASWDRQLIYERGFDMGSEHKGKGVDVQLGPVVGPLGRAPEGGRNWEGFSPDPFLSGEAVYQSVQGIQAAGVVACTKHYIMNEQADPLALEHFRQVGEWGPNGYGFNISQEITSNLDDRTMHELYLWPFADAVRAGTGSIMCSYNFINGSYGCQNSYTLNHLLKNELDFQGFVMSDWGAQQ